MSRTCDVLVVGGGGAALRAAIAACEAAPQARILLVTKGALGQSGVTATACSDRMAFHATLPTTEPGGPEAWRYHAEDIYRLGGEVSDADLAAILAQRAAEAFDYLDRLGVPWARTANGAVDQFVTDGSRYARACYTGPHTAQHIEQALLRRLRQLPVEVIEHAMVGELLLDRKGERVIGAALIHEGSGAIEAIGANAVILATGGAGQVFAENVYPADCTGDGLALAYRAGAELVNLEFIQIGLCSVKTHLACSGSMMRALPRLVNDAGEEFLPRYFPTGTPLEEVYATLFAKGASWPVSAEAPSHIIDLAVDRERRAGRRVYLDYARNPQGLRVEALPGGAALWYRETKGLAVGGDVDLSTPLARLRAINRPSILWLKERGVDLEAGECLEIAPAVQHFQGGVKIRTRGNATIPSLYAAGEVAGGQHGANRPGGNALLDGQVFGRLAGEAAVSWALGHGSPPMLPDAWARGAISNLFSAQGAAAEAIRRPVQEEMSTFCGVYRTEAGLKALCDRLAALGKAGVAPASGEGLSYAVETLNILQVAHLVARAALERDESRGPHLRFAEGSLRPLPRDDARWRVYLVLKRGAEGPLIERREPVRLGL